MRQPDNRRDVELFEEVFSDPARAGDALSWDLNVAGAAIDDPKPISLRGFSEDGAPAWALEGDTITPFSHRWRRKDVRLDLSVEGRTWREFRGKLQLVGESEDTSGTFGAATSGYYQGGGGGRGSTGEADEDSDTIKFNERTEYTHAPTAAYLDMLSRFPYRRRKIPKIAAPEFVRSGENAYQPNIAVGSAIDELEEESGTIQTDRPLDEAIVLPRPRMGGVATRDNVRRWRVGREVSTFSADSTANAEFYNVNVVLLQPNGLYLNLLGDNPKRWPRVRYPAGVEPPPVNCTYYHEITEEDATNTASARAIALTLATVLQYGEFDVSMTLDYIDPRIEDYDVREVLAVHPETDERALYRILITSQERNYTDMQMTLGGVGVIVGRPEVGRQAVLVGERSTEGAGAFVPRAYGVNRIIQEPWFNDTLDWASLAGDDLVFDTDNDGAVALAGDELVVSG